MMKRFVTLLTAVCLILIVALPASAGMQGPGVSGVNIQNLSSSSSAKVDVQLWPQDGGSPISINDTAGGDTIPAQAAKNYYLPNKTNVPSGSYAMVVSADQPIAAIARTEWSQTGGAALYSTVDPGTDVVIPLVTANFASQTTQFSIQNTDTQAAAADVDITVLGRGLNSPVQTLNDQNIPAGTSKTYDLGNTSVFPNLPNTGTDMGASGFVGSIRITSSKELVVQSFIDLAGTRAVTAFTGVPTASADTTLYCPLIRANYYGDTGISIVNPGGSAADVDITFYADAGSPNQGTFTQDISVPANSSAVAFQGPGGNSRAAGLPGGSQTSTNPTPTNDGFYGVAKLVSSGNILAVVNDAKFGAGWAVQAQSTYNCVSDASAGTRFALPLVRKNHLSTTRLTTGINIQNISNGPVTVHLDIYNWDGTRNAAADPTPIVIPANSSGNFFQGNLNNVPTVPPAFGGSGWFGAAILWAEGGPIAAVVADEAFGTTANDSANYNALLMPTQ